MLRIYIDYQEIDLLPNTSIQLELNNPLFDAENDIIKGSFSMPFTIPLTARNRIVFSFPDVIDNVQNLLRDFPCFIESDGETIQGVLKLRNIDGKKINVNLTVGISAIGKSLQERKIYSFDFGGLRVMGTSNEELVDHMNLKSMYPDDSEYIFAPIKNPVVTGESDWDDHFKEYIINDFVNSSFVLRPGGSIERPRGVCPFPKLRYVLLQIMQELGIQVEESFFDAEMSRLFLISNAGLERIIVYAVEDQPTRYDTTYAFQFRIGDLLPDLTVIELLRKLALTFGLAIQVTLNNKLILGKLNDIIASDDYIDVSHLTSSVPNIEITEKELYNFIYKLDGDDSEPGEKIKDFADLIFMPDVATYVQLISLPDAKHNHLRYVKEIKQYYVFLVEFGNIAWKFYCDDYGPIRNGEGTDITQGIAPVIVQRTPFNGEGLLLPTLKLKRYLPDFGLIYRSPELRLLFYRGLQSYQTVNKLYPLLTDEIYNTKGEIVGNYSLRLGGEHGTYENFLKSWYQVKGRLRPVKKKIAWSMLDIANLDMSKKLNIDGDRYLIRKVSLTLPIRKPVDVDLVYAPKSA